MRRVCSSDARTRRLFRRMAERCGIDCRYSVLAPSARAGQLDDAGLYREGAFADTGRAHASLRASAPAISRSGRRSTWTTIWMA